MVVSVGKPGAFASLTSFHQVRWTVDDGTGDFIDKGPVEELNSSRGIRTIRCHFDPVDDEDALSVQLSQLAWIIAHQVEHQGGLLLHGALAERDGKGVILAGPGDVGKTTASRRLPSPWRSLCDDMTLIVCDHGSKYWAHPWPTWSNFMFGGQGGSWTVHHAVPLQGLFFLQQAREARVEEAYKAEVACLLNEVTEQVSWSMFRHLRPEYQREHRLRRFETICTMARKVPAYRLSLEQTGAFWREIEKILVDKAMVTP